MRFSETYEEAAALYLISLQMAFIWEDGFIGQPKSAELTSEVGQADGL